MVVVWLIAHLVHQPPTLILFQWQWLNVSKSSVMGASAVYGADAIGGVINFITKKSFEGLNISVGATQPEASGGDKQDISIFGGYGNLDEQGFNVYGVVDYRRSNNIMAKDRKISRRGGVIPELGLDASSANAFPANIFDPKNNILANPYGNTKL